MSKRYIASAIASVVAVGIVATPSVAGIRHHGNCEAFTHTNRVVTPVMVDGVMVGGHVVTSSTIRNDCAGWRHDTTTTRRVARNVPLSALH